MARNFSDWLEAYVEYTKASEAPTAFHLWTGVATIAGALRRQVWRDEHIFQWVPNFYILLIGPAGVAQKSTTANLGMALLRQVDDVYFGQDSGSWQALGDSLAESTMYFKVSDGKGNEVPVAQSAVTIAASELGTFFRPDDEHAISFLTDIWDGKARPYIHRTRDKGKLEVQNPLLNILGATTPEWIQRNIPANLIGEGLISRIVFVYGEEKRHLAALPSKRIKTADFRDFETKLVEDLREIGDMRGNFEFEDCVYRDGGWMDLWYEKHNTERPAHLASSRHDAYLARKQTHLVKLAMIFSAARSNELVIRQDSLEKADSLLVTIEAAQSKVFESIGLVDEARHVAEIVAFVRAHEWMTSDDIWRKVMNLMSQKDFEEALRAAVRGGILEVERRDGRPGVKPSPKTVH